MLFKKSSYVILMLSQIKVVVFPLTATFSSAEGLQKNKKYIQNAILRKSEWKFLTVTPLREIGIRKEIGLTGMNSHC